jgi:hypothetical protein
MKPDAIIIHHSLSRDRRTQDWDAIRRFHTSWRFASESITAEQAQKLISEGKRIEAPWSDIGYHFGIELVETEYAVCIGRAENVAGAHCTQQAMNQHSLGVCFVGNFDLGPVPKEQWEMGAELVAQLCSRHTIDLSRVFGHRDFASYKSCPGNYFVMEQFREDIARFLL